MRFIAFVRFDAISVAGMMTIIESLGFFMPMMDHFIQCGKAFSSGWGLVKRRWEGTEAALVTADWKYIALNVIQSDRAILGRG